MRGRIELEVEDPHKGHTERNVQGKSTHMERMEGSNLEGLWGAVTLYGAVVRHSLPHRTYVVVSQIAVFMAICEEIRDLVCGFCMLLA